MSKITIIEGNSNNKDNVRAIMVKGEKGEQGDLNNGDIIDNLTSIATDKVLSAKQGKVLKDLVDTNTTDIETNATNINNETSARTNADTTLQNNIDSEVSARENADNNLQSQITGLASGSPKAVNSISEMTDTTKNYVLTTDGHWYYYNGTAWADGGIYQSTGIADGSININNFSNDLDEELKIEKYEKSKGLFSAGSFSVSNNRIVLGNTSNLTRTRGVNIPINYGDIITFNNENNTCKVTYAFTDVDGNVLEYITFDDYLTGDYDNYKVKINNVAYLTYAVAYQDNRQISVTEDRKNVFNLVSIYSFRINDRILDNRLDLIKIRNIVNSKNILPQKYYPFAFGDNTNILYNYESAETLPQAMMMEIEKNTHYYIKTFGIHNRFRILGLYEYPTFKETFNNTPCEFLNNSNIIVNNDTLTEYDFINTDFKYIIICVNSNGNITNPKVMLSKESIDNYEDFEVSIPGLELPSVDDLNYKVFDTMTRNLIFDSTAYPDCEMQGICSDGTYLYYGMHDENDTDDAVIGKIEIATGTLISEVKNHSYGHINGMCYDGINNQIIIASMDNIGTMYRVDPETLNYISSFSLENTLKNPWENYSWQSYIGVGAIGYSDETGKFVVLMRKNTNDKFRGFAILDSNLKLEKLLKIDPENNPVGADSTTTVGGLDCDDKYIYLAVVKRYPGRHQADCIQIYDYNGNLIDEYISSQYPRDFIEGLVVEDNLIYTSNGANRVIRYDINAYKNIPLGKILKGYNLN